MAYCDMCGAYIPDGQTKCLACGYDKEEQKKKESAAAQQKARRQRDENTTTFRSEELRRELIEQRKRQQERNRVWAEQERARRQERQRAQEAQEARNTRDTQQSDWADIGKSFSGVSNAGESKLFAAISYLGPLFLVPMIFRSEDDYAAYHARQGLSLFLFGIVADFLSAIGGFGWVLSLFRLYCIFKGIGNAVKGIRAPLPLIGKYGEKKS